MPAETGRGYLNGTKDPFGVASKVMGTV